MERGCCDLPEEVWEEIMSWLPSESVIRFKLVCKAWYTLIDSLIKNPAFVNKHLCHTKQTLSSTCLVFCYPHRGLDFRVLIALPSLLEIFHDDDNESDHLNYVCEDFFLSLLPKTVVLGCCNGVICLDDSHETLVLSNPAIKKSRILPKPCLVGDDFEEIGAGLGYDWIANDYIVVRFGLEFRKPRAELYRMSTDSWREIEIDQEFDIVTEVDSEVFCKGVFYWCMWPDGYTIVSFGIFDEKFHSILLPDNLQTREKQIELSVWNESLALFFYPAERGPSISIEVWVMDEDSFDGVKGSCSWIQKLTIGPIEAVVVPWRFWKNDELLLAAIDGRLVSYNLRSQKLRNLAIHGLGIIRNFAFSYVKSLVSVEAGNKLNQQ